MQTANCEDATRLTLLTRDGAIQVEFMPALDARHYAELFEVVKKFDSGAVARQLILDAAKRWQRQVTF